MFSDFTPDDHFRRGKESQLSKDKGQDRLLPHYSLT